MYFILADGEDLSVDAVRKNIKLIVKALRDKRTERFSPDQIQWLVIAIDVNWENPDKYCSHTNERIESAYAEEDTHQSP